MSESATYPTYARTIGVIELICPACGQQFKHTTGPRGPWVIQCTRAECRRHWAIGYTVRPVANGHKAPPVDCMFPSARYIARRWKTGEYLNTPIDRATLEPIE